MKLQPGTVLNNKYRITQLIGEGGMGAVYAGENVAIARRVAIKVLHSAVAEQVGVVERFEREAQAAGRIGNDHILEVLDLGTLEDGSRFMVMEFLDGENLEARADRLVQMSPEACYPIVRQLLVGLGAAHAAGIIHRDLKPENIFVLAEKAGQPDFVKIIDFGISKFTTLGTDMKMTATGAVMGTPYYMSPEQARGTGVADPRSDTYAVGVILFKLTTGQVPFRADSFNELLFNIVLSPTPSALTLVPDLDPAFETLIRKAMAREPSERFAACSDFIQALDAWHGSGARVSAPPAGVMHDPSLSFTKGATLVTPVGQSVPERMRLSMTEQSSPGTGAPNPESAGGTFGEAPLGTGVNWANSGIATPKKAIPTWWFAGGAVAIVGVLILLLSGGSSEGPDAVDGIQAAAPTSAELAPIGGNHFAPPKPPAPPPDPKPLRGPEEPESQPADKESTNQKAQTKQANTAPKVQKARAKAVRSRPKPPTRRTSPVKKSRVVTPPKPRTAPKPSPVSDPDAEDFGY